MGPDLRASAAQNNYPGGKCFAARARASLRPMQDFPAILRHWRGQRRLSQLALAAEAGVSARHVSFLESGRARPSREMVLRLSDALEMPRAARNEILGAAGFADLYPQSRLDGAALAPVRLALDRIMARHDPYPAVLIDREWTLVSLNAAATRLFGAAGLRQGDSALAMLDLPGGPVSVIENWGEVGHHMQQRLRAESRAAGGIDRLDRAAARLARDPEVAGYRPVGPLPPVIPTIYRAGRVRLSLFSSFLQIGGAEDIALTDLRLELMFPMDADSAAVLEAMGAG